LKIFFGGYLKMKARNFREVTRIYKAVVSSSNAATSGPRAAAGATPTIYDAFAGSSGRMG